VNQSSIGSIHQYLIFLLTNKRKLKELSMSTSQAASFDELNDEGPNDREAGKNSMAKQSKQQRQFLATDPRRKSPLMASILSLLPGLGQV